MNYKEELEWLEEELKFVLKFIKEYQYRESMIRTRIDKIYDTTNTNDNTNTQTK